MRARDFERAEAIDDASSSTRIRTGLRSRRRAQPRSSPPQRPDLVDRHDRRDARSASSP